MKTSPNGVSFIAGFEGFQARPYNDTAGNATFGYGHLLHKGPVRSTDDKSPITQAQGLALLTQDVQIAEDAVNRLVQVPLTQNEFDALVSFTYNLGQGTLAGSTLLKLLNQKNYDAVPAEFKKWIRAGGVVSPGLVRRRAAEALLFQTNSVS